MPEIARVVNISCEGIHNILHHYLNMRKLFVRWMTQLLTIDQNEVVWRVLRTVCSCFGRIQVSCYRRIITSLMRLKNSPHKRDAYGKSVQKKKGAIIVRSVEKVLISIRYYKPLQVHTCPPGTRSFLCSYYRKFDGDSVSTCSTSSPPFSLDLAPPDHNLLPKIKKKLIKTKMELQQRMLISRNWTSV